MFSWSNAIESKNTRDILSPMTIKCHWNPAHRTNSFSMKKVDAQGSVFVESFHITHCTIFKVNNFLSGYRSLSRINVGPYTFTDYKRSLDSMHCISRQFQRVNWIIQTASFFIWHGEVTDPTYTDCAATNNGNIVHYIKAIILWCNHRVQKNWFNEIVPISSSLTLTEPLLFWLNSNSRSSKIEEVQHWSGDGSLVCRPGHRKWSSMDERTVSIVKSLWRKSRFSLTCMMKGKRLVLGGPCPFVKVYVWWRSLHRTLLNGRKGCSTSIIIRMSTSKLFTG